jgi:hypothetical protein
MNNENELHDVTFKIRYPSKKEKIIYAVKSILIDELTILAESIAIAAILCSFFSNEWSIPQKYNVFVRCIFCFTNIDTFKGCINREIHLKRNNHSES